MTAQIWRHDPNIFHESPHCMLILSVSKALKPLSHKIVHLPTDDDKLDELGAEIAKEIDQCVGSLVDRFYTAVFKASERLGLIRTHKG